MSAAPIYVVVSADGLNGKWLQKTLEEDPQRKPSPIVFETNVNGATLEKAQSQAAQLERAGYGACRIGRVVFEDEPGFAAQGAQA